VASPFALILEDMASLRGLPPTRDTLLITWKVPLDPWCASSVVPPPSKPILSPTLHRCCGWLVTTRGIHQRHTNHRVHADADAPSFRQVGGGTLPPPSPSMSWLKATVSRSALQQYYNVSKGTLAAFLRSLAKQRTLPKPRGRSFL